MWSETAASDASRSAQLDPETDRDLVRAYQLTCAEVIQRFEGHIGADGVKGCDPRRAGNPSL